MTQKRIIPPASAGLPTVTFDYTYDVANHLVKVETCPDATEEECNAAVAKIAEYGYDPFGRRLWKEVSGTRTYFFYADEGLVAEFDASGTELKSYGYRPDSSWTTDPLWLKENGEYYFYQNDHLGTPQKLVKQNGAVVWSANYSAFGQARVEVDLVTTNLRFPGQYFDAETGLHYNYFRYYASGIGRYLRIDPLNFLSGDSNLYKYVFANPIAFFDSVGLCCTTKIDCINKCWQFMNPDLIALLGGLLPGNVGDMLTDVGTTPLGEFWGGNITFAIFAKLFIQPGGFSTFTSIYKVPMRFKFDSRFVGANASVGIQIILTWKLSTLAGCVARCVTGDSCDYDIVPAKGWILSHLLLEGIPELYYNLKYRIKGII